MIPKDDLFISWSDQDFEEEEEKRGRKEREKKREVKRKKIQNIGVLNF